MRSLAIIEPDPFTVDRLRSAAELAGFEAEHFRCGAVALDPLRAGKHVLALVDLEILDVDPYALCRDINRIVPIITIAAQCGREACIHALESGADDCVSRATSARELVARIQNVLRRRNIAPAEHWLRACVREMRYRDGNVTYELTRGEAEILSLLLDHSPAPVTVAQIAEALDAGRDTVVSRIKTLRRKIGAEKLVTRGALGYQLNS